ncbi:MAG: aminotransferase class III-fold pyridoxal phosphate-dependent enzyme [Deltaproteobacteria bacterium]|nr:aminotransferase class III-fold pyridoxal phosphate-dependent enzyme [Deltaproteobacteria bacterium]
MGDRRDAFDDYARYVNPAQAQFLALVGRAWRFERAEGCTLYTEDGLAFDDWIAGFGSLALGHNPEVLREVVTRELSSRRPNLYSEVINPAAGSLAKRLVESCGFSQGHSHFCNSGSEAVETLLKAAVAATGRRVLLYASGGYHGATVGALSCMAQGLYRTPFEAMLPRYVEVEFNNVEALEEAFARYPGDVAGVLLEPVQMESGVVHAEHAYLRAVRAQCDRAGALMMLDEVQCGLGRTGTPWAFLQSNVQPDGVASAKALGGGLVAIGAAIFRDDVWCRAFGSYDRAEIHASTMGGNGLACAVAERVLDHVLDPAFLREVQRKSARIERGLREAIGDSPLVCAITMHGLLGGVRFADSDNPWLRWESLGMPAFGGRPTSGPLVVQRLARCGVLAQVCGHDWATVRVEPPLVVSDEACDRWVDAMASAVAFLEDAS